MGVDAEQCAQKRSPGMVGHRRAIGQSLHGKEAGIA